MGEVIELREHKLREFLRDRLGPPAFNRAVEALEGANIADSFRLSHDRGLVYVEPELLQRTSNRDDPSTASGLELLLDALQRAPGEIRELLDTDGDFRDRG